MRLLSCSDDGHTAMSQYENLEGFTMFTKKTTKLTKIEASALSIAQWCIIELLPKEFKDKPVFFTQATVSTLLANKLDIAFGAISDPVYKDMEFKAMNVKAYFTILDDSIDDVTPYVNGEILFARAFETWMLCGLDINVTSLLIEQYPCIEYDTTDLYDERFPLDSEKPEAYAAGVEREKRLQGFINKFFDNAIFDKKSYTPDEQKYFDIMKNSNVSKEYKRTLGGRDL